MQKHNQHAETDHGDDLWSVSPFQAGVKGVCPKCGKGPLFSGILSLNDSCSGCGFDLKAADPADGPAVFVMFILGTLVVGLAMVLEFKYHVPFWVHLAVVPLFTVVGGLWLLRVIKGWMVAMQFQNDAREGSLDNQDNDDA